MITEEKKEIKPLLLICGAVHLQSKLHHLHHIWMQKLHHYLTNF